MPRHVLLFSGHMIDRPDRSAPRFPPDKEGIASTAIGATLDDLGAGPGDLGFCGGAAGGDLLFAEACLARGLRLEVHIPFDEPTFLDKSVAYAGNNWTTRYHAVVRHPNSRLLATPGDLGPQPDAPNPYARNNRGLLDAAFAYGSEHLIFLCLWDGAAGDGPGGTKDMVDAIGRRGGRVLVLDTRELFFGEATGWGP